MSAQGIAAVLTSAAGLVTAIGALLHSVQTRKQVKRK